MRNLLFIFFSLTCKISLAQFDFAPDTAFVGSFYSKTVDTLFNLPSDVDFELRLSVNPSLLPSRQLFVLSSKDNKWSLRHFEFSRDDTAFAWREVFSTQDATDVWLRIQASNPLQLRSENELKDQNGNELQLGMLDGVSYVFELKNKEGSRQYYYRCPKAWLKKYPNVKEFRQASDIIESIYRHFAKARKISC